MLWNQYFYNYYFFFDYLRKLISVNQILLNNFDVTVFYCIGKALIFNVTYYCQCM